MKQEIEKKPSHAIYLKLLSHPIFKLEPEKMEAIAELLYQSGLRLIPEHTDKRREAVASLIHDEWQKWAENIMPELDKLTEDHSPQCLCKTCQRIKRWKAMFVPYSELPEQIKEYDRPWADKILSLFEPKVLSEEDKIVLDFAYKVGRVMDDLRSSNVFFILQQAYGDMDWEEAQGILNLVVSQDLEKNKEK